MHWPTRFNKIKSVKRYDIFLAKFLHEHERCVPKQSCKQINLAILARFLRVHPRGTSHAQKLAFP